MCSSMRYGCSAFLRGIACGLGSAHRTAGRFGLVRGCTASRRRFLALLLRSRTSRRCVRGFIRFAAVGLVAGTARHCPVGAFTRVHITTIARRSKGTEERFAASHHRFLSEDIEKTNRKETTTRTENSITIRTREEARFEIIRTSIRRTGSVRNAISCTAASTRT